MADTEKTAGAADVETENKEQKTRVDYRETIRKRNEEMRKRYEEMAEKRKSSEKDTDNLFMRRFNQSRKEVDPEEAARRHEAGRQAIQKRLQELREHRASRVNTEKTKDK